MRPTLIAVAIVMLATTAHAAPASPPAPTPNLGPWQMMTAQTHDDLPGTSGVFLLNTETGQLFICMFIPSGKPVGHGCISMPKLPDMPG